MAEIIEIELKFYKGFSDSLSFSLFFAPLDSDSGLDSETVDSIFDSEDSKTFEEV